MKKIGNLLMYVLIGASVYGMVWLAMVQTINECYGGF